MNGLKMEVLTCRKTYKKYILYLHVMLLGHNVSAFVSDPVVFFLFLSIPQVSTVK